MFVYNVKMSASCLRTTLGISKTLKLSDAVLHAVPFPPAAFRPVSALSQLVIVRHGSFFGRKDADAAWDSVRSVSNQGRKRGRASRNKIMKRVDLYAGQKFGQGTAGVYFPGLMEPITGKSSVSDLTIKKDSSIAIERSQVPRKPPSRIGGIKQDPLDRGFRGNRLPGKKIAGPDPIDGYDFKDFEAYVLESKLVSNIVASQGTVFSTYVVVALGNKKGLIGLGIGKASTSSAALKTATNKAAKQLVYIDICDNRTLWHNFTETFHKTSVIARPMYAGFGHKCHPVLKILCELLGIRDIAVVTEGNGKNYLNVARAFITGLQKQRSYQELADALGHHIVEYSPQRDNYPLVIASPSKNAPRSDFKKEDGFKFENYCFGNRVELKKKPKKQFFTKFSSYLSKKNRMYTQRHQHNSAMQRMILGMQPELKRTK